ncbi:MAG: DsbE family thiol:disulfide interchange protein [Hyphomicrobiaceae bacterium]|nr:DsbE family thiol:disulfide interchange protein [Hyphomicrobiaceae bacterium]
MQPEASTPAKRASWLRFAPLAIFAAIAALFGYALQTGDPSKLPSAIIGRPVPAFVLPPVDGLVEVGRKVPGLKTEDLAKGKVTIVNFWASWCIPCHQEHPLLLQLKAAGTAELVGINYKDQSVNARRFLGRYGNPFSAIGADESGRVAIEWGVYGMPETFVVDKKGRVVFKHVGPLTEATLKARLMPAVLKALAD